MPSHAQDPVGLLGYSGFVTVAFTKVLSSLVPIVSLVGGDRSFFGSHLLLHFHRLLFLPLTRVRQDLNLGPSPTLALN